MSISVTPKSKDHSKWYTDVITKAELAEPDPSTEPPRSLTTTLAPLFPRSRAYAFPKPLPAPVTITTLSSKDILDIFTLPRT